MSLCLTFSNSSSDQTDGSQDNDPLAVLADEVMTPQICSDMPIYIYFIL